MIISGGVDLVLTAVNSEMRIAVLERLLESDRSDHWLEQLLVSKLYGE